LPAIIDYPIVLDRMTRRGFRCNYPNSGAFGFRDTPQIRGWIGPADASIKPELSPIIQFMPPPYEANLVAGAVRVWQTILCGPAWIMPASHWHFEFHDGSRDWMPGLIAGIGIDPNLLRDRADGSAIEFSWQETAEFSHLLSGLLTGLKVSDFSMAFPDWPVLCLVHHHKQLWWTSADEKLIERVSMT
jgi:hypothetical protein